MFFHRTYILAMFLSLTSISVFAEDNTPETLDKSQYTLFNSVPDDLMRSFSPDRPTKSNSPYTVDAGHFQYEMDFASWTYDHYSPDSTTTSSLVLSDPTFKVGLTQNMDFELALSPFTLNYRGNHILNTHNTSSGFGDIYTRIKYNLFGNDGGNYALALVPYIKVPTASGNIGNSSWEGGGYIPFVVTWPNDWTMTIESELDMLENQNLQGMHANYQNLINFAHPVFSDTVTGSLEFWSDVNNDYQTLNQYTLDFAITWLIKDNVQLDAGVNFGLNKAANDLQPYLGISQRF